MWNYTDLLRKIDDLKQFMLCSEGIFKMWQNCHSENIFDRPTFC